MLNRFNPPRSYHYYERIKLIPDELIHECLLLAASTAQLILMKGIRQPFDNNELNQAVSFIHFKRESLPFFLRAGKERDIQHGYCSIIEIENYLMISNHGADDFHSLLSDYTRKISAPWRNLRSMPGSFWGNEQQTG
ncbi:hypothetical protein [Paraflavitalea pollutisoli]|uniref:hypothetical protein n=1 Tax=Paraflavitalea pollutisoli TaxID=3034143 RepID=UPI0023ED93F4|nr:hypothetical protein [Paraflavitalea sp. H1-2-19X]